MKSLLLIALLTISPSIFAKAPVSKFKLRVFEAQSSNNKLWCMSCDRRSIQTRGKNNQKTYLNVTIQKEQSKVEVQVIKINDVGEEVAKKLGYDGSASNSFIIVNGNEIVSSTYILDDSLSSNLSSFVEKLINKLSKEKEIKVQPETSSRILSLWELKASGQFNY